MNTFLLLALLFLGLASVEAATSTVCEGAPLVASCPNTDDVIKVTFVMYGRQDATTCPHASVNSATAYSCQTSNGDRLAGRLNGVNSITWSDNKNSFFGGDPCPNIYKYLTVEYDCVPSTKHSTFDFCEKSTITPWVPEAKIQCPPGKFIKVNRDASYYGRQQHDDMVCPYFKDHNDDANCMMATLNGGGDKIGDQCDGLNSCQFTVSNTWFGNDPCVNTYKYAHVEFDCEAPRNCTCNVKGDPLTTTFDNAGTDVQLPISGSPYQTQCDLVNTMDGPQIPDVCQYKIAIVLQDPYTLINAFVVTVDRNGLVDIIRHINHPIAGLVLVYIPNDPANPTTMAVNPGGDTSKSHIYSTVTGCEFSMETEFDGINTSASITFPHGTTYISDANLGFCGTCDNNQSNDYKIRNGTYVGNVPNMFSLMSESYCYDGLA